VVAVLIYFKGWGQGKKSSEHSKAMIIHVENDELEHSGSSRG
jgi:hypothetical protein